jgi:hypothetical protein
MRMLRSPNPFSEPQSPSGKLPFIRPAPIRLAPGSPGCQSKNSCRTTKGADGREKRNVLNLATSKDGLTRGTVAFIEKEEKGTFSYPAKIQAGPITSFDPIERAP